MVDAVEISADGTPAPAETGRVAVPPGQLPPQLPERVGVVRGVAQAVLPEHFEGHALRGLRQVLRIGEHGEVGVGVHVDETRREHEPVRVDDPVRSCFRVADGRYPTSGHGDVGPEPRRAGAVDDIAAAEDDRH